MIGKWVSRYLVFMAVLMAAGLSAAGDMQPQFDATCRVSCPGGVGSGCVFNVGADFAAVLTAAHVIEGSQTASCEFWSQGHQSAKLPAQVLSSDPSIDAAVLLVPTAAFAGRPPAAIPLGTAADQPAIGDTIQSVGCAAGAWATGWQGHVTRYEGGRLFFVPPPAGGRSGSVITNAAGDRIVGLLQIRTSDGEGGATTAAMIRSRMEGRVSIACRDFRPTKEVASFLVQCPGGVCPPSAGSGGGRQTNPNGGRYLLPWNVPENRQGPTPPAGGSGNPWPTLPNTAPIPAPAPVPLPVAPIPSPTPAPAFDPRVDQALGLASQADQKADALLGTVQAVGKQVQDVAGTVDKFGKALSETSAAVESVHDVIAAKGGLRERLAMKRADLEAEGEDPSRFEVFKAVLAEREKKHWWIVGLAIAGIAFVIWDVRQKRTTGDPLAIEKLAKFARRRAVDSVLPGAGVAAGVLGGASDLITRRLDALDARLHGLALNTPVPGNGSTSVQAPPAVATPASAPTINVGLPTQTTLGV